MRDALRPEAPFPAAARTALADATLRANLRRATSTIRRRRDQVVGEVEDWDRLRAQAAAIKDHTLRHLDRYLAQLEAAVAERGGQVHWARDAAEARDVVADLVVGAGARRVLKVKSLTTEEIGLNDVLAERGVEAVESDLAELIVQLGGDRPSHIVVPAIHKNRFEIRDLFARAMGLPDLAPEPTALAEAARLYLRERFLAMTVGISGANFLVADTGAVAVVESEGNGRMCLTLPHTLITVAGIDKVVPTFEDLGVFLRLLARSATGERMNPYTTVFSGVVPGDGPQAFHLVLVDNGRTRALADPLGRTALRCIRCAACLNVCPVYERVGGHAYGSVYPGPIGAVLTPQLRPDDEHARTLPYASTLCGACADVCPVGIPIPRLLVHLRSVAVRADEASGRLGARLAPERLMLRALGRAFAQPRQFERLQALARVMRPLGGRQGRRLPGLGGWTRSRALPTAPRRSFRRWWREEHR
ncbi:MAG: lactate utilization protein [Firmicutes bacterium]|nr:lactate utilization protein [Bacillota bacterium]